MNIPPIFDDPDPSSFLSLVKDKATPIDVEKITNQKKFEVRLYFSKYEKFININSEVISESK